MMMRFVQFADWESFWDLRIPFWIRTEDDENENVPTIFYDYTNSTADRKL